MENPTIILLTDTPFDQESLISKITLPETGAVVVFYGVVRGLDENQRGGNIHRLEYEAYLPMAEEKMKQVADEIRARWSKVQGIVIVQRLGSMEVGSPITLIACSSAHRDSGVFEAVRYGIDRLKEIVPVWKKEIGENGDAWMVGNYRPKPGE